MNDLEEIRGYWKLKEEEIDHTLWTIHFGSGHGRLVRLDDVCTWYNTAQNYFLTAQFISVQSDAAGSSETFVNIYCCIPEELMPFHTQIS